MIDWFAFVVVLVTALVGSTVVVVAYAFGIRLLTLSGRTPIVTPAEFTDAITVISEKDARRAEKAAAKAAKKSPLTDGEKRVALVAAYLSFGVAGAAVLGGLLLILFNH